MYSEPIDVLRGLKAGASDYISKCADTDELLAAIYWALDDLQKSGRHCVVHRSGDNFMLCRTHLMQGEPRFLRRGGS